MTTSRQIASRGLWRQQSTCAPMPAHCCRPITTGRGRAERGAFAHGPHPRQRDVDRQPRSVAPGFTIENVHVMAGVPAVFQAMVASVLPTLTGGAPLISQTLRIDRGEGDIAGPLGSWPRVSGPVDGQLSVPKRRQIRCEHRDPWHRQRARSTQRLPTLAPLFLMTLTLPSYYAVLDATWPAAALEDRPGPCARVRAGAACLLPRRSAAVMAIST